MEHVILITAQNSDRARCHQLCNANSALFLLFKLQRFLHLAFETTQLSLLEVADHLFLLGYEVSSVVFIEIDILFSLIVIELLESAGLSIKELLVLPQTLKLSLLLKLDQYSLSFLIITSSIWCYILLIFKRYNMILEWVEGSVILLFLSFRLDTNHFLIDAGAAAAEDCDKEEGSDTGADEE